MPNHQIDIKNVNIYMLDGTPVTPNKLLLRVGDGSISFKERRSIIFTRNRGKLDLVREGDEVPVEVDIDLVWEFLKSYSGGGVTLTPHEFLKREGAAAAFVSTSADACEPYAIDLQLENIPNCGTNSSERITLAMFRPDKISGDFRQGMLKVSGRCNIKFATGVRF